MRIGLYNGSTLYPLAGASGVSERVHSSAGGFVMDPAILTQPVFTVRGTHGREIERGNLLHTISFSSTRMFASVWEAQLWALAYDVDFPRIGTLYLDAVKPDGTVMRSAMENAVVKPPRRVCLGATIKLDYTVTGGAISALGYIIAGGVTDSDDSYLTDTDGSILSDP